MSKELDTSQPTLISDHFGAGVLASAQAQAEQKFNLLGMDFNRHSVEPPPTRESLEQTLTARTAQYGDFTIQAKITQDFKKILHNSPQWYLMLPYEQEALEMVVHKIARIVNGNPHYVDSWHDIVGYAKLVEDRLINQVGL